MLVRGAPDTLLAALPGVARRLRFFTRQFTEHSGRELQGRELEDKASR